jgi:hypothetical protein
LYYKNPLTQIITFHRTLSFFSYFARCLHRSEQYLVAFPVGVRLGTSRPHLSKPLHGLYITPSNASLAIRIHTKPAKQVGIKPIDHELDNLRFYSKSGTEN